MSSRLAVAALLAVMLAGCSGGMSGFLGGAAPAAADAPGTISNENPMARPIAVAWTSARVIVFIVIIGGGGVTGATRATGAGAAGAVACARSGTDTAAINPPINSLSTICLLPIERRRIPP